MCVGSYFSPRDRVENSDTKEEIYQGVAALGERSLISFSKQKSLSRRLQQSLPINQRSSRFPGRCLFQRIFAIANNFLSRSMNDVWAEQEQQHPPNHDRCGGTLRAKKENFFPLGISSWQLPFLLLSIPGKKRPGGGSN